MCGFGSPAAPSTAHSSAKTKKACLSGSTAATVCRRAPGKSAGPATEARGLHPGAGPLLPGRSRAVRRPRRKAGARSNVGFQNGVYCGPHAAGAGGSTKEPRTSTRDRSQDMPRSRRYLGGLSGSLPACHPGSALPPGPGEPVGGQGGLVPRVMRAAVAGRMGTGKRERQEKPQMPLSTKSPVVS